MTDSNPTERTLVLLRHGKAVPPDGVVDRDRPLTERGRADAVAAGAWLARHHLLPDVVICSPARRTRETWHAAASGLTGTSTEGAPGGPAPRIRYESSAYAAETADLLALLRSVEPTAGTVLLVGHNPAVSLLSIALDDGGADRDGLPTGGVVVHRVTGPWSALGGAPAAVTAQGRAPY
ncbi:histidine phosphatase family protein [Micromonospora sp. WMMD882]|uniref:SixA phosphatase family protein n=1 Tax=Micromonospora sp. WMMD882 TaxID=3015151 RepID=UPI00248ADB90|nr:histidine phosphatase family protein [Micromonospora sp. WMMD882]WBB78229.1 histidine phosphatase family protein [Micromonospora sp. WMMD882]